MNWKMNFQDFLPITKTSTKYSTFIFFQDNKSHLYKGFFDLKEHKMSIYSLKSLTHTVPKNELSKSPTNQKKKKTSKKYRKSGCTVPLSLFKIRNHIFTKFSTT